MSQPLRDDAVHRTHQAWIRTGLGAAAVAALAVRAALLGSVNGPALVLALVGVAVLIGIGVHRGRQARAGVDIRFRQAWLVAMSVLLLGTAGAWLALSST